MRQGFSRNTLVPVSAQFAVCLCFFVSARLEAQQDKRLASEEPAAGKSNQAFPTFAPPPTDNGRKPLPITLPIALQLANARALDIAAAGVRINVANALLDEAKVLWLPTIAAGGDYFRHDGRNQDATSGIIFDNDRSTLMFGVGSPLGTSASVVIADAIFAPLAARQTVQAREADLQAAANDTLLAVAESYINVQQARGELAGDIDATQRMRELVRRTEQLAEGLVPPLETIRAKAELSRRQQAERIAHEHWRVASARLLQLLHLDPGVQVEPLEPPHLYVPLLNLSSHLEDLIVRGLTTRPELAAQQAQIQAYLIQLQQERCARLSRSSLFAARQPVPRARWVPAFSAPV